MFSIYISWILTIVLHESLHVLMLAIYKIKIERIRLGNFFYLRYKKIYMSPIVFNGSVIFQVDTNESLITIFLIYLLPGTINIILFYLLPDKYIIFKSFNFFIGISSLFPLARVKNDMSEFLESFKLKINIGE